MWTQIPRSESTMKESESILIIYLFVSRFVCEVVQTCQHWCKCIDSNHTFVGAWEKQYWETQKGTKYYCVMEMSTMAYLHLWRLHILILDFGPKDALPLLECQHKVLIIPNILEPWGSCSIIWLTFEVFFLFFPEGIKQNSNITTLTESPCRHSFSLYIYIYVYICLKLSGLPVAKAIGN